MEETNRLQSVRRATGDLLEQFGQEEVLRSDPPGGRGPQTIIEFELTADLAVTDASVAAQINVNGDLGDTITVWNPKKSDSSYVWDGADGAWGAAYLRSDGKYVIIQLEC